MVLLENGTMEETSFYPEPTKNKFLVNNTVSVIPVPFSGGQGKRGVELGPIELEKFGLIDQLKKLGYNVTREGTSDVDMSKKPEFDGESELLKNPIWVSNTCKDVAERVQSACAKGNFALTLGGDHSIAVGTIAGTTAVYGDDLCVVWVDAHAVSLFKF
ncbi:Arginase [Zancudomyces culisetae]|uniref:Arginase n=1 Tax=Zancudomyces culisetae TaxID=1213189 RepID=A0A1R1PXI5_ZANCU|nr:Arginase [Zancudomyces culisetae]|eukprot:OMH85627.1 Arginase [Zancudomyces culisetae]